MRLNERHFRILGVIASYDRFGKNGQGCYVNRDRLAQESRLHHNSVSDATSDLRMWGYIISERHPLNRRTLVHRVVYAQTDAGQTVNNRSSIDNLSGDNRSPIDNHFKHEKVAQNPGIGRPEKSDGVEPTADRPVFILSIPIQIRKRRQVTKEDIAQKRGQPRKQASKQDESPESVEAYLSEVESCLSDASSRPTAQYECERLCEIAENTSLPEPLRSRAATLREIARAAA